MGVAQLCNMTLLHVIIFCEKSLKRVTYLKKLTTTRFWYIFLESTITVHIWRLWRWNYDIFIEFTTVNRKINGPKISSSSKLTDAPVRQEISIFFVFRQYSYYRYSWSGKHIYLCNTTNCYSLKMFVIHFRLFPIILFSEFRLHIISTDISRSQVR